MKLKKVILCFAAFILLVFSHMARMHLNGIKNWLAMASCNWSLIKVEDLMVVLNRKTLRLVKKGTTSKPAISQPTTPKASSDISTTKENEASSSSAQPGGTETFANCTELRKKYPNGVPSSHLLTYLKGQGTCQLCL